MSETPKETSPSQEEGGQVEYMNLRNRKVMTPTPKPKKTRKSKKPQEEEEVAEPAAEEEEKEKESSKEPQPEEEVAETTTTAEETTKESQPEEEVAGKEKTPEGIMLRSRFVPTPQKTEKKKKKKTSDSTISEPDHTVSEIESIVAEAEKAVRAILEKRSVEKTVGPKKEKTESHGCIMCMIYTIFVIFAIVSIIAGMFGFYAVKGEYYPLFTWFDYGSILGKENGAIVKNALKRFDNVYTSLDIRMQVIFDSALFFSACCICGLCWLARAAIKAREESAKFDPVHEIEKMLNWRMKSIEERKKICEKLDSKEQSQQVRINNLKLLQNYEAQIEAAEKQITKIWEAFGAEILEASKQS